nr:MAG TPA: hypothetical protein [Caudoviricetes sp.]
MCLKYELYVKRIKLFRRNVLKITKAYFIASLIHLFHAFKFGVVQSAIFCHIFVNSISYKHNEQKNKYASVLRDAQIHFSSFFFYFTARAIKNV